MPAVERDSTLQWALRSSAQRDTTLRWNVTLVFAHVPSYATAVSRESRLHKAQFKDGAYAAREAEGINYSPQKWELVFDTVSTALAAEIDSFVRSTRGIGAFDWVNPAGVTLRFTCDGVTLDTLDSGMCSVSLVFEQDFSP